MPVRDAAISVFVFAPALAAAQAPRPAPADTVAPSTVGESAFPITSGALTLDGTLTLPAGATQPVPAAVIIAGSGPTDRDGNAGQQLRTNMYAQLAWRLGERGIATLRYNKRGLPGTTGTFTMATTTFDDFAADAAAAARALAGHSAVSHVVLVGHSEGAGLALRASDQGAPAAGVALIAGLGRPFVTVLREQLSRQLDSANLARFDTAMARYLGDGPVEPPPGLGMLFLPVNRRFVQTTAAFDATATVARIPVPVLIVQGAADLQVRVADAEALHAARPDARLAILPGVNHVMKHAEGPLGAQLASYRDPTMPVAPELIEAVAAWILSVPAQALH